MIHTYSITGLTCNNCVAKATAALNKLPSITTATVQLASPQATITMDKHVAVDQLQGALSQAGNYSITEADGGMPLEAAAAETRSWLATYKPILLVFAYITGITLGIQLLTGSFRWAVWMNHFMAGFFLVFSFFKLLDLNGFADGFSSYDIIARTWRPWAYIYAFIELALGISYLLNAAPLATNVITLLVMGTSITGVLQSVIKKRQIRCACLGAVFNLPMSTVTIVEDALMIAMSLLMLITML